MTIATTHAGSLPRPADLTQILIDKEEGRPFSGLEERATSAVAEVVAAQAETGLTVVNDGEQGKAGYSTYVRDRLLGFGGETSIRPPTNDSKLHPDFAELSARLRGRGFARTPACNGPIALADREAVHRDIANLTAAADAAGVARDRLFMSAASPGVVSMFFVNQYYATRDEYKDVLGEERVVAGCDCGFDTFVGRDRVSPSVVWAKLGSLVEGARLASGR